MRLFILLFIFAIFMIPTMVSAHTDLSISNPADGQVISQEQKEISLTFEEEIEKLSTMELIKDGKKIPFTQINVQRATLIGVIAQPMDNGSYVIQWKIAGKDGHIVNGKINFQVKREQKPLTLSTTNSNQVQANQGEKQEISKNIKKNEGEIKTDTKNAGSVDKSSFSIPFIFSIGLLLILVIPFLRILKRK